MLVRGAAWVLVILFSAGPSLAQSYSSETRLRDGSSEEADADGPRTTIELEGAAESATSLAEELEAAPSVEVRRSGGIGSPAFLSIRGSDPYQVRVTLDGVPLNGARNASFDLATVPVELLGSATVHRGITPVQTGSPLPGGALELRTRFGEQGTRVFLGGGSFGSRRVGVSNLSTPGDGDLLISATYAGSANRYQFFDDGGTPFNEGDDREIRRANADVDAGGMLIRHRERLGSWRLTSMALASGDSQGVPGLGSNQAIETSLDRVRALLAARIENGRLANDRVHLELIGAASLEWQHYQDPADELGLGVQDNRERGSLTLLGLRPTYFAHEMLTVRGVVDWTSEGAALGEERAGRNTLSAGAEAGFDPLEGRVLAQAGVRLDSHFSRLSGPDVNENTANTAWSPRAGLLLEPFTDRDWSVRATASVSSVDRTPGFFELYGDRGGTVGNPDLLPERSLNYDVSAQFSGAAEHIDGALIYGFFDRRIDDLIVFVQTGLGVAIPQNIADAAIRGHEFTGELGWHRYLRGHATYSLTDAVELRADNPQLPGRPVETFAFGLDAEWRSVGLSYLGEGNGLFYVDRQESRAMPARIEHDVVAKVSPNIAWRPVVALAVHNLADARSELVDLPDGGGQVSVPRAIADFVGQPLPGRSFHFTLTLHPGS